MTADEASNSAADQGISESTMAVFSMKQAAEVARVSVSTLRRRRDDLVAAGADISPEGWQVPVTALVACGLLPGEGPRGGQHSGRTEAAQQGAQGDSAQPERLEELTAQVRELEREVLEWRRRAEVAEARAEERGRALDALQVANEAERLALRMLTSGTPTPAPRQPVQESTPPADSVTFPPTPQASVPAAQSHNSPREGPLRKGFFSRVLKL